MRRKRQPIAPKRRLLCHRGKQQVFAVEYLKDFNASQAAIRAGYSANHGLQLLRTPWVAAQVDHEVERRANKVRIDAEYVLREIAAHASANIYDFLEIDHRGKAKLNHFSLLNRDIAKGLAKCRITKDGFSITLTDRLKALELLGKHLGLFGERREHDLGYRDVYVQIAAIMGLDKASDQELEEASRLLEGHSETSSVSTARKLPSTLPSSSPDSGGRSIVKRVPLNPRPTDL